MAHTTALSPLPVPPADESLRAASDLRAARRRRRLGDTEWGELAYRVYTTTFFCLVVGIMLSGMVGDSPVDRSTVADVAADGPAWIGLLFASVVLLAVRSGSRGGPLAVEAPDVNHVLMAPPDRTRALRRPTVGTIGYGAAAGLVLFALVGSLASQRLPGSAAGWMASGALFGAILAATALGAALVTCSNRVHPIVALGIASVLVVWSVADAAGRSPTAPTSFAGDIMLWPIRSGTPGLPWVAVAGSLAAAGILLIGGLSLEKARRRTELVAQLRFAVTQQDLRSVVLLRRQLASETLRARPHIRVPGALAQHYPIAARDARSIMHWPAVRVLRVLGLAVLAALATRGVFSGTTPLVLAAGVAAYVAGLDTTEGLSEEIDHPVMMESFPLHEGLLMLRHLVVPCVANVLAGLVGMLVVWALEPSAQVLEVGVVVAVTGGLAGVAGATVSTVSSVDAGGADALMTPEVAGPRLVFRVAWPPLVAVIGFLPALVAARVGGDADPAAVAASSAVPVLVLLGIIAGWVRFRPDIHRSMAESMRPQTSGGGS